MLFFCLDSDKLQGSWDSSVIMKLDFDKALEKAGGFGYIQLVHFLLIFTVSVFQTQYNVSMVFIGQEPTFACQGRPGKDPCQLQPPCQAFIYGKEFTSIVSEVQ